MGISFNSYMCGECFSWYVYDGVKWALFQLIYVRGMFRIVADTMQEFADVSTHICAGNVSRLVTC